MTISHYQEVHNLKQEIKRLRLLIVENKVQHDRELRLLKQEIVQPKTNINDNPTTWGEVLRVICEVMDMTPDQIIAKSRKRKALYARHMFNHICRKRLGMTFMEIGSISHLDHSTMGIFCITTRRCNAITQRFTQSYTKGWYKQSPF
jgi:chromosomal replication initiation ATPase DnaA